MNAPRVACRWCTKFHRECEDCQAASREYEKELQRQEAEVEQEEERDTEPTQKLLKCPITETFVPNTCTATCIMVQANGLNYAGLQEALAGIEKDAILTAVKSRGGSVTRAAQFLGMKRTTLVMRLKKYGWKRA